MQLGRWVVDGNLQVVVTFLLVWGGQRLWLAASTAGHWRRKGVVGLFMDGECRSHWFLSDQDL